MEPPNRIEVLEIIDVPEPDAFLVPSAVQSNVFESAFLGDRDMDGTVEIKVQSGGPVSAYASQIDNRTQDPILIPAIEVVGAAVD